MWVTALMVIYKTQDEIELIRQSCLLVSKTLALAGSMLNVGITGKEIDKKAEEFIRDHDAVPGFLNYNGFPNTLCISVNEQVVHGIPSDVPFKEGDIVSIDCGVYKNEFFGDAAYTFAFSGISEQTHNLLRITRESLYKGIEVAKPGNRIGDIGNAVQQYTEKVHNYGVVRELVGHGIGRNLHEKPEVPNYGSRGRGPMLKKGLVIALEPMINLGTKDIMQDDDGWTIVTKDRMPSAHYEHSLAITAGEADILSDHSFLEEEIKNNPDLVEIS